ncbi:MAG: alpha/beta fold hydrolase [Terrimonas sp.]|nr:alpha/beta fold hydrolase [Terrimonas sp.]
MPTLTHQKNNMKKTWCFVFTVILMAMQLTVSAQESGKFSIPYGNNPAAGKYVKVNGINMYYETYGTGSPLVLIHGNGGSIASMGNQIEYFKDKYRIIVADSRAQGKSGDAPGLITYEQITDDWSALLDALHIDSAYVIGWSDGGIESLLMAIRHPEKVKMMAVMGANLQPDSSAVYPWAVNWVKKIAAEVETKLAKKDTTQNWMLIKKLFNLLGNQPHIPLEDVQKIKAPTLVMGGDKDVIREEHTLQIYQHLQKAWLCIFPGETHMIPETDPGLFNQTVEKFFSKPYYRPDTKDFILGHH